MALSLVSDFFLSTHIIDKRRVVFFFFFFFFLVFLSSFFVVHRRAQESLDLSPSSLLLRVQAWRDSPVKNEVVLGEHKEDREEGYLYLLICVCTISLAFSSSVFFRFSFSLVSSTGAFLPSFFLPSFFFFFLSSLFPIFQKHQKR